MADIMSAEARSRLMSKIGPRDTMPELALRSTLHRAGFRFRLHAKELPGKPDIVLPKYRTVIFVHGCFWHRHPGCRFATMPASNIEFWKLKFASNVKRDARTSAALRKAGWRVEVVWECFVRRPETIDNLIGRLVRRGRSLSQR